MKRLSKEKRDKIIMVALVVVAILAGLWFGLIRVQNDTLNQRRKKIEETRNTFDKGSRLVKQADRFKTEYETASARLRTIEASMVSGDAYSWIIKTISRFQSPYKLEIPNYSPPAMGELKSMPKFPYQAATFALRGNGYFHEFGKFLADFENNFPCITVQNLDVEPLGILAAHPEEQEKISFKMEIVALVKPKASL